MAVQKKHLSKHQGFSLIVVLLMLVAISLLGVTSYTLVTSSSRSASSWGDRQRALGLAESGLQVAETEIQGWIDGEFIAPVKKNLPETDTPAKCGSVSSCPAHFKARWALDLDTLNFKTDNNVKTVQIESGNNRVATGSVKYIIVYEGKVGSKDRVTVYVKTAGARDKTNSIISATYEIGA